MKVVEIFMERRHRTKGPDMAIVVTFLVPIIKDGETPLYFTLLILHMSLFVS